MTIGNSVASPPVRYSLRGYAAALSVLFSIFIGLGIVLTAAHVWRATVFDRLAEGRLVDATLVSEAEADAAGTVVVTASVLWLVLALVAVVIFVAWQFRHAQNARTLGATGGLSHPAWAIAGWFIPVANVVLGPVQIYRSRAPGVGRSTLATKVISWWAIALVLGALAMWAATGIWVDSAAYRFDFLRNSTSDYLKAIASLISAAAAACVLYMVRTLTRRQDETFDSWRAS